MAIVRILITTSELEPSKSVSKGAKTSFADQICYRYLRGQIDAAGGNLLQALGQYNGVRT